MNLRGIACGFAVLVSVVVCAMYGIHADNTNPVVNGKFSATAAMPRLEPSPTIETHKFPGTVVMPKVNPQDNPPAAFVPVVGADTVYAYGQTLMSAPSVEKKLEMVRALEAAAPARDSSIGLREPQAVEILSAAFAREGNVRVKVEILNALAQFNAPEACELLNRALEDGNDAVRIAAQQAKAKRELRLRFVRCCE